MRKKLLLQQIDSLQARVKHLEECIKTQDLLLEGYQNRESAVIQTLQKAQKDAENLLAAAEEKARRIEEEARQKSARMLAQTEATVAEYRDTVDRYNTALESIAAEAAESAERFARLARSKKVCDDAMVSDAEGLSDIPFQKNVTLPDPQGDPARLIHNIYRLQNRVLPEEMQQEAKEPIPTPEETASEMHETVSDIVQQMNTDVEQQIDSLIEEDAELHTVSTVLETLGNITETEQELSLDDLLDEIIKSGEQYHG